MTDCQVYFIQAGDYIKIGITTNVKARMAAIQNGCPMPIELIRTVLGGEGREAHIHSRFRAIRIHNEWFKDTPELRTYIQSLPYENDILEPNRVRYDPGQWVAPEWLDTLLKERGIDLYQLRDITSLHERTVCEWASRLPPQAGSVSISVSGKVAKALGIKHSEFEAMRARGLRPATPDADE